MKHQDYLTELPDADMTGCNVLAYYIANWRWDLALYMAYVSIWIKDVETNEKVARVSYRTCGALDKFIDAEEKIVNFINGMCWILNN